MNENSIHQQFNNHNPVPFMPTHGVTTGSGYSALPAGRSMRSSKLTKSSMELSSELPTTAVQPVEEASPLRLWPGGWVLYEISTRPWLYSLSKKYKRPITKLLDIPDEEFLALKEKGIDHCRSCLGTSEC